MAMASRPNFDQNNVSNEVEVGTGGQNIDFNNRALQHFFPVLNATIGEQGIQLSPLQVASLLATVAGDGTVHFPQIVREVRDSKGEVVKVIAPPTSVRAISPETALQVRMMLEGVTLKGTGKEAWVPQVGTFQD
ncbi:MAG: penicillin-binding transpeptidase domain-containing protein [Bacillota bacterium]